MSKQLFDAPQSKAFTFNPFDVVIIGLDTDGSLCPENWQPRRNSEPLLKDTLTNIKQFGVKKTINVRRFVFPAGYTVFGKVLEDETALPVAVDGRQRIKYARQGTLELREEQGDNDIVINVTGKPEHGSAADMVVVQFSTNQYTTPEDAVTRAENIKRLVDLWGDEEAVARKMGFGVQRVREYLAINGSVDEVKDALSTGVIATGTAARLGQYLTEPEQREVLKEAIAEGKTSMKAVEQKIRKTKERKGAKGRVIKNATFGPEFDEPSDEKADKGTPSPNRRQILALHQELERILEEDSSDDESTINRAIQRTDDIKPLTPKEKKETAEALYNAADNYRWFLSWNLFGRCAPPIMLYAIENIRVRALKDGKQAAVAKEPAKPALKKTAAASVSSSPRRVVATKGKGKAKGKAKTKTPKKTVKKSVKDLVF